MLESVVCVSPKTVAQLRWDIITDDVAPPLPRPKTKQATNISFLSAVAKVLQSINDLFCRKCSKWLKYPTIDGRHCCHISKSIGEHAHKLGNRSFNIIWRACERKNTSFFLVGHNGWRISCSPVSSKSKGPQGVVSACVRVRSHHWTTFIQHHVRMNGASCVSFVDFQNIHTGHWTSNIIILFLHTVGALRSYVLVCVPISVRRKPTQTYALRMKIQKLNQRETHHVVAPRPSAKYKYSSACVCVCVCDVMKEAAGVAGTQAERMRGGKLIREIPNESTNSRHPMRMRTAAMQT